jgi:hypothetical protein
LRKELNVSRVYWDFTRAFEQQRDPVSACDIGALQPGFNVSPAATMVDYRL